jgi:hypothetical protein
MQPDTFTMTNFFANLTLHRFGQTRRAAPNSTYKKLAVQWLNVALCYVSSSVVADSFRLRNRQLLVAAKRQAVKKTLFSFILRNSTIFKTDFLCLFAF